MQSVTPLARFNMVPITYHFEWGVIGLETDQDFRKCCFCCHRIFTSDNPHTLLLEFYETVDHLVDRGINKLKDKKPFDCFIIYYDVYGNKIRKDYYAQCYIMLYPTSLICDTAASSATGPEDIGLLLRYTSKETVAWHARP